MIDVPHNLMAFRGEENHLPRPTIHDVARTARVSLATVDRVLNKRGGVAEKSVRKVERAVVETGYIRDVSAANLSRGREYRFTFILPDSATGFVALLRDALTQEQARFKADKVQLDIVTTSAFEITAQVEALRRRNIRNSDGIALIASEAPEVQAEIARLTTEGVPVLTLVSDLPRSSRHAYVGPDNVVAGRTAATFMGRFVGTSEGAILMIAGSLAARDHMERVMGFRMVMTEQFPRLALLPAVQGFDTADTVKDLTRQALGAHSLAGIYAVGAGTRGLLAALKGHPHRPIIIAHELTDTNRGALLTGEIDLVIDQNPAAEVQAAITLMRDLSDQRPITTNGGAIPLSIFVRENI